MMDHFSTAQGGLIWLESFPRIRLSPIKAELKSFVLGNSHQPKDTKYVLANVKNKMLEIVDILMNIHPDFSLRTADLENLNPFRSDLSDDQFCLLSGTIRNRDISFEAKKVLEQVPLDHKRIGDLLNEHQAVLRDALRISTPKIDRMIDAALKSGAYGAKIYGSGGGGCMFAYAPENPETVAESIRAVSEASVVHVDEGTKVESILAIQ
jgi:galactokinase